MKIVIVDDEKDAVDELKDILYNLFPQSSIVCFYDGESMLQYIKNNRVDIAFLDIEMPEMNGIALAKYTKDIYPDINIIFVTAYSKYALDSYSIPASSYLLKPVTEEMIKHSFKELRNPLSKDTPSIRVQTFGNFEIFVNDHPLHFGRIKAKELLAYLVDRKGACSTIAEIMAVLWDDKPYSRSLLNQTQNLISAMMKTLKDEKADHIIIKQWNSISVDINSFECDYYSFLKGDSGVVSTFANEYMTNYSWAEFTVGILMEHAEKK